MVLAHADDGVGGIGYHKLCPTDQLDAAGFGCFMGLDQAGIRAFIGYGDGVIAQFIGLLDELFRVGSPA